MLRAGRWPWTWKGLWLGVGCGLLLAWGRTADASPGPLLGPDGPLWLGPLGPDTPGILARGRDTVVVDPRTGELWVERTEAALSGPGPETAVRRVYRQGAWHWTTDDRLVESPEGAVLHLVEEDLTLSPRRPRPTEQHAWPLGTELTAEGTTALRVEDGWAVSRAGLEERYDPGGWLVSREGPRGTTLHHEREEGRMEAIHRGGGPRLELLHDPEGRISVIRRPDGSERYVEHDDAGLRAAGGLGRRTRYVTDEEGRLVSITWPDDSRLRIAWDSSGRITSLAGPGPRRETYTWTDEGVEVRNGPGAPLRLTWTDEGYEIRDPAGRTCRARTAGGRLLGWEDPAGQQVLLARSEDGLLREVHAQGTWRLRWRQGRIYDLIDPAGGQWLLERNGTGDVQALIDPDGRRLGLARDPQGRVRTVQRGALPWRFERDARGRLVRLQSPTGAVSSFSWGALGADLTAEDPSGQTIGLEGLGTAEVELTSRLGETWTIAYDVLGRPTRIHDPSGAVVELRRNSLGRLASLAAGEGVEVTYGWRGDGLPSRLTDPVGTITMLRYDLAGRLVGLERPDGTLLEVTLDPRGEVVAVVQGEQTWPLRRDARGHPTELGGVRWAWDLVGRWLGWSAGGTGVELVRSGAGVVRRVAPVGTTPIDLDRDAAGRVSRVRTGEQTWALERDPAGNLRSLRDPEGREVVVARDDRGLPALLTWAERKRRILRDAAGNAVRWTASTGAALSTAHGPGGRPGTAHLPDGSLVRWTLSLGRTLLELLDPAGRIRLSRELAYDGRGRPVRVTEDEVSEVRHWDPLGELVVVDGAEEAWSWLPDRLEGPAGQVVILDADNRPLEAVPPVGPTAWGVAREHLAYVVGEGGAIEGLTGDRETLVELRHDALGHPVQVLQPDGTTWELTWDPFGRPVRLTGPEGGERHLGFGPLGLLGWTEEETATEVLTDGSGAWALVDGDATVTVLADETGSPRLVLRPDEDPLPVRWGHTGMPDLDPGIPLGWGGTWSLFPGGPLLDGAGAWDPVSGTRTAPAWRPPWWTRDRTPEDWPRIDGTATPAWDPSVWAPRSPFSDPLELLVRLGELDVQIDPAALEPPVPPLPWLPSAAGTPAPPLSDRRAAGDPQVELLIEAVRPPVEPLTSADVLAAVLAPEWEGLPDAGGLLTPGEDLWTAGLERWLTTPEVRSP